VPDVVCTPFEAELRFQSELTKGLILPQPKLEAISRLCRDRFGPPMVVAVVV
jgi:hypothetical protein